MSGISGANDSTADLIFVVEDDLDTWQLLRYHLDRAGYQPRYFPDATQVLAEAERHRPSLILLDAMLPGEDGFGLCQRLRLAPELSGTCIVMVTARAAEADRIRGLEGGADDYISKPFSPRELLARVKAVLRPRPKIPDAEVLNAGPVALDATAMKVTVAGKPVTFTLTEFRLLEFLVRHRGRVFSRAQLLTAIWNDAHSVSLRAVDVYIRRIREKIELAGGHDAVRTIRGAGYKFESD